MSIASLAPELFEEILGWLPTQHDRQQATLQLTRAIPRAPIPLQHLFEIVGLHDAYQVESFYRRIRSEGPGKDDGGERKDGDDGGVVAEEEKEDEGYARMIRSLHVNTSGADTESVLSILDLAYNVEHLSLCVDPTFLPAHLQAALKTPKRKLTSLEIRLCPPNCEYEAKNLSFDESYLDSALSELARWSAPSTVALGGHVGLRSLSLIQEPLPSCTTDIKPDPDDNEWEDVDDDVETSENVDQPTAFSSYEPLTKLLASSSMSTLRSLTVRIPGKVVTPNLSTSSSAFPSVLSTSWPLASRSLRYLDVSTTDVCVLGLRTLLSYTYRLKHLVLEETDVIPIGSSQNVRWQESWEELGFRCATVGQVRAILMELSAGPVVLMAMVQEGAYAVQAHDFRRLKELRDMVMESTDSIQKSFDASGLSSDPVAAKLESIKATFKLMVKDCDDLNDNMKRTGFIGCGVVIESQDAGGRKMQKSGSDLERTPVASNSAFSSDISRVNSPSNILSKLGLAHKSKVRIVPYPPALRTLHISLNCNKRSIDVNGDEASGNRQEEAETARRNFKLGWESGIDHLREAWRELKAESSAVPLMFRDLLSGEDEQEEEREEVHQETVFVPATTDALDALLAREFACPKLSFAGEGEGEDESTLSFIEN